MTNVTISRELLENICDVVDGLEYASGFALGACDELRAALAAPVQGEAEETVPKWRYDALIQHYKLQDKIIAKLRDERNTACLYEQKEVWFWQGDGEDYLESLVCPVVIKADDLRALLAPPQPAEVVELVERMKDAERNEKHWNVQQTRYWCNQYKLLARAALAKLQGK